MLDILWNFFSFVVVLGVLITGHEYGHYWVARKCGVKVKRFSVGFGKEIYKRTNKEGTEFVVAAIPLGGFVSMLDERAEEVPESLKSQAFNRQSVYKRIAIIAAGPIANFIIAIIAFYFMFMIGMPGVKPVIGELTPNSIAAQGQLPANSEIVAINGKETDTWQAVNLALVANIGKDELVIDTRLPQTTYVKSHQLDTRNWQFEPSETTALTSVGIVPFRPQVSPVIAAVSAKSAAEKAGLKVGDEIVAVNHERLSGDWQQLVDVIKVNAGNLVVVDVVRNGETLSIDVTPDSVAEGEGQRGFLGVSPTVEQWPEGYLIDKSYGPIDAFAKAWQRTGELTLLSFEMIGKLLSGDVSVKNLSGPISIAQGAGNSAGHGLVYLLSFLALISINLGIINLLPLPVLDGGHLLFYFIELLSGKPVPEKVQEVGYRVGAIMLLCLMSIAIFNDLSRL